MKKKDWTIILNFFLLFTDNVRTSKVALFNVNLYTRLISFGPSVKSLDADCFSSFLNHACGLLAIRLICKKKWQIPNSLKSETQTLVLTLFFFYIFLRPSNNPHWTNLSWNACTRHCYSYVSYPRMYTFYTCYND